MHGSLLESASPVQSIRKHDIRWPNLPNNVASLFGVANWVGADLYIPKTVEDELEGQFVRGANAAWDAMASDLKELTKLCNQIIAVDVQGKRPHDDDLRAAFRTRSNQLKDRWRIEKISVHEVDLATLLEMAINRDAPFEEIEINKSKRVVTGLQDTAILFAIASHMKTADRDERCALISNDGPEFVLDFIHYASNSPTQIQAQHVI
jgi:hypothetical protein